MTYQLDSNIAQQSIKVIDLTLCEVRLQNERRFPWVILIPKIKGVSELIDLSEEDYFQLTKEIKWVSRAMKTLFNADKLNVASLGNIVKQLHVHVIVRYKEDLAWPNPVWGFFEQSQKYAEDVMDRRIHSLQKYLTDTHDKADNK